VLLNDVHYQPCAVIKFLVAKKESVRICGIAILDRSTTVGHWVKRVMGSKMGKAELHYWPCSCRVAQVLVSKFCNMLMRSLMRIDATQCKIWHLGFKSAEEVLVASLEISDI
jgi:hypothetical protein